MFAARRLSASLALALAAAWASPALAQTELFDGVNDPGLFKSDIQGFTFGTFDRAVSETRDSFIVQAKGFGGVGRDLVGGIHNFDAGSHRLLVEFRFMRNDTAKTFNAVLVDVDGTASDGSSYEDQFQFSLEDATQSRIDNGFTAALFDITAASSRFNAGNSGENVANYGLKQFQLQSTFGTQEVTHLEVRRVAIVSEEAERPSGAPPEPGSLSLLLLGPLALLARRRPRRD